MSEVLIRRRTPEETRAYHQGYLAGLKEMAGVLDHLSTRHQERVNRAEFMMELAEKEKGPKDGDD